MLNGTCDGSAWGSMGTETVVPCHHTRIADDATSGVSLNTTSHNPYRRISFDYRPEVQSVERKMAHSVISSLKIKM